MPRRPPLTPSEVSQRARLAALTRWSREDPKLNAERGQAGLLDRFRREVREHDPDVQEPELTRRAEAARRAHMTRLAFDRERDRRARRQAATGG